MKTKLLIIFLLSLLSCQSQKKEVELYSFDRSLSLVKVNEEFSFRSKSMTDCGYKYWYSNKARNVEEKFSHSPLHSIKEVMDWKSLRLEKVVSNAYHFKDKTNKYLVLLTICDNSVSYERRKD